MTRPTDAAADNASALITADPHVPIIHISREFVATPEQLLRAHTVPSIFAAWIGPAHRSFTIDYWDARTGGSWRYTSGEGAQFAAFHGCFHEISPTRLVQTFTWEGMPESVSLETMTFEDLGDGRTMLRAQSLVDSFTARDAWLASGMPVGVNEGYLKLEELIVNGTL